MILPNFRRVGALLQTDHGDNAGLALLSSMSLFQVCISPWQHILFYFRISELISHILGGGESAKFEQKVLAKGRYEYDGVSEYPRVMVENQRPYPSGSGLLRREKKVAFSRNYLDMIPYI